MIIKFKTFWILDWRWYVWKMSLKNYGLLAVEFSGCQVQSQISQLFIIINFITKFIMQGNFLVYNNVSSEYDWIPGKYHVSWGRG